MLPRRPTTLPEAIARQARLLRFGGVLLVAQLVYTVVLWVGYGEFPVWSGVALLGLWIFYAMLLRQHRRLKALPQEPDGRPRRKRKRFRDPHRKR